MIKDTLVHETQVSPEPIMQMLFGIVPGHVLQSAVELEIFAHIEKGNDTLEKLAQAVNASERGLRILLNALVGLGLLERNQKGGFHLTPVSEAYLVKDKPFYIGNLVTLLGKNADKWRLLTQCVRSGKPASIPVESDEDNGTFFSELVQSLFPVSVGQAEWVAGLLEIEKLPDSSRALDIGAGSGVWSLAMVKANPGLRVTAVDREKVLKVTRDFAERFKVSNRYEYVAGNFRDIDFGQNLFDVAILGHICHSEGEQRTKVLFKRIHQALKSKGRLIIADFFPDNERVREIFPMLFAVNMLVQTEQGDTFTVGEYISWLKDAGFSSVRAHALALEAPPALLVAEKG